jgi:hypothetical protein
MDMPNNDDCSFRKFFGVKIKDNAPPLTYTRTGRFTQPLISFICSQKRSRNLNQTHVFSRLPKKAAVPVLLKGIPAAFSDNRGTDSAYIVSYDLQAYVPSPTAGAVPVKSKVNHRNSEIGVG